MKIMETSFKRSMRALLHSVPPTLPQATTNPRLCRSTPPPETPGHSRASLGQSLWGHCSFLLGPGVHKLLFVPSKSLFPQSCVSFSGSMVGLTATSTKRIYAIPKYIAPRAPDPAVAHCWPVPPQETLKHSSGSVSVGSLGPGAHKVSLSPPGISGGYRVWF